MYHSFKAQLPQEWGQLNNKGDDIFRASDGKFLQNNFYSVVEYEIKLMNT